MRSTVALTAFLLIAVVIGGCRQGSAQVPCPPQDNMPLVVPDASRHPMSRITPDSRTDSAVVVTPPCPDRRM